MPEIKITVDLGDKNKSPVKRLKQFDKDLTRYLEKDLSNDLKKDYGETVKNWSGPPEFRSIYRELQTKKVLTVGPHGRGRKKWGWVSDGTPRRTITAKRPNGMMRFPRNYTPKTTPGGSYGGPGLKHGPIVLAKRVSHQINARKFSEKIKEKQEPKIKQKLERMAKRI